MTNPDNTPSGACFEGCNCTSCNCPCPGGCDCSEEQCVCGCSM